MDRESVPESEAQKGMFQFLNSMNHDGSKPLMYTYIMRWLSIDVQQEYKK